MIELHLPQLKPYSEIKYIGIAFGGSEQQRHIGVLFRNDLKSAPKVLHLAWHLRLLCCDPENKYCWLDCPGFDEEEQLQLAVWFEKIFDVNGHKIPYGINYSHSGHFAQSGSFRLESGSGLTCATFVMALFQDFGLPIIDFSTWQTRESDKDWQSNIISTLCDYATRHPGELNQEHIDAQIVMIGEAKRFRPEEVVAAAFAYNQTPMDFFTVAPLGEEVLSDMTDKWDQLASA